MGVVRASGHFLNFSQTFVPIPIVLRDVTLEWIQHTVPCLFKHAAQTAQPSSAERSSGLDLQSSPLVVVA
jgi:hypothetical protein